LRQTTGSICKTFLYLGRADLISDTSKERYRNRRDRLAILIQYGKADVHDTVDLITGQLFIATVMDFGEVPIQSLRKTRFGFPLPGR
jgi:hypothetical protein